MTLNEKLQNIRNQLSLLLSQLKKMCVTKISLIPTQIEKVSVGTNKLPVHLSNSTPYEINENDLIGATEIRNYMFRHRTMLTSITIPYGVTRIEEEVFSGCSSLVSISIPNSVTSIGNGAFSSCEALTNITIPDSVTSIGGSAFYNCSSLTSITIPDSVMSIVLGAFKNCNNLESISVNENNTNYSSDEYGVLFNKDKTILMQYPAGNKNVEYSIPESTTIIEGEAFIDCDNLTIVIIPNSVVLISYSAFDDCANLANIYIHSATPPTLNNARAIPSHTTIHVPIGSGDAYKNATNWSSHADKIVEDITLS